MSRNFRIFAKDLMTKESAEISTHKNTEYTETGIGFGEYVVWFGEKAEKFGDDPRHDFKEFDNHHRADGCKIGYLHPGCREAPFKLESQRASPPHRARQGWPLGGGK